ncbi:cyclic nucleotide-binding domain-containing protein [Candidatus Marinimicrobia bacterium MT.SAG.4]|nr:cyclic nucleotide-binding domain-containing protein [Candidatus Marinimicrobia bacterium MT.SAG.4]
MTTGIEKDFQTGDTVCRQGDSGEYIYILKKGSLGVYKNDNLVSQYRTPGTILGEMSIILGEKRTATIKALSPSTVSVIRISLIDMVRNFPSFRVKILQVLAERLRDTTEELSSSIVEHQLEDDFK